MWLRLHPLLDTLKSYTHMHIEEEIFFATMKTTIAFLQLLLLLLVELEFGTAQECRAQVVVTTQEDLKNQISSEIARALNYNNSEHVPSTDDSTHKVLLRLEDQIKSLDYKIGQMQKQIDMIHEDGLTPCYAAGSCAEILKNNPDFSSGYYWVKNATGHPHRVYCDMTRSCGGVTGGWMRVAYLDMTNAGHQCPSDLGYRTVSNIRTCVPRYFSATCSSAIYKSEGMYYSKVCGSIQGYYGNSLDGFVSHNRGTPTSVDSNYVDGVSLTHGTSPRNHIWTFSAGTGPAPAYINNHYFCDNGQLFTTDLRNRLWDGTGCLTRSCCTLNSPPWFYREFSQPTIDDIEMRLCRDQDRHDEDILIEKVEIYVN